MSRKKGVEARLYQALLTLLDEESYDKITVRQICEHAGLVTRTFYNHFTCKDDLTSWRALQTIKDMLNRMGDRVDGMGYRALLLGCFEGVRRDFLLYQKLPLEPAALRQSTNDIVERSSDLFVEYFVRQKWDIPKKKLEFLLRYHFGANSAVIYHWIETEMEEDPEVLVSWMIDAMPQELRKHLLGNG